MSNEVMTAVEAEGAGRPLEEEMEQFLSDVMDALPDVTQMSCNTILSRIKDIKGLRL